MKDVVILGTLFQSFALGFCNCFVKKPIDHSRGTFNSLASGCFQGFSEKKTPKRMWLCAGISPVCSTDPVKVSKDGDSLLVCTRKKIFCLRGCGFFVSDVISGRTFRPPWPTLPDTGCQPLSGSISLKFLLETRLQSESFDTLDYLLGFWVQKLRCKLVKIFD